MIPKKNAAFIKNWHYPYILNICIKPNNEFNENNKQKDEIKE